MNLCEYLRKESINNLFTMQSFANKWHDRVACIKEKAPVLENPTNILNLGDSLSDIFRITIESKNSNRSQSDVSSGGAVWEGLVCWYLNLCLIGSRTVVIKHSKKLIPSQIADAITVNYHNTTSNTESDLIAITFPDQKDYDLDIDDIKVRNSNGEIVSNLRKNGTFNYNEIVNALVERDFDKFEVSVIQCKTNWNDNAQIPMLWDMIYSAKDFKNNNITIGKNGYSINSLSRFSYCFVTVPTSNGNFNPSSTAVQRVINLTGGNYWGKATQTSVASSIKEIINRNFSNAYKSSARTILGQELKYLKTKYNYFHL